MSRTGFEPFVARAVMETSVSMTQPIPFEGILGDVLFRAGRIAMIDDIPCLAYRDGIAQASCGVLVEDGIAGISRSTLKTVKSLSFRTPGEFQEAGIVDAKDWRIGDMSPYRSQIRAYDLLSNVSEVVFQFLGDGEAVERLLEDVPAIGAQRRRGLGVVREWRVEPSEAQPDEAGLTSGDRLLRRLPLEAAVARFGGVPEGSARDFGSVRTPYWGPGAVEVDIAVPLLRGMTTSRRECQALLAY